MIVLVETVQIGALLVDISLIKPVAQSSSTFLASLVSIKQGYGQPRKYLEQVNVSALSNIYFL